MYGQRNDNVLNTIEVKICNSYSIQYKQIIKTHHYIDYKWGYTHQNNSRAFWYKFKLHFYQTLAIKHVTNVRAGMLLINEYKII